VAKSVKGNKTHGSQTLYGSRGWFEAHCEKHRCKCTEVHRGLRFLGDGQSRAVIYAYPIRSNYGFPTTELRGRTKHTKKS